ncbi:uncharacterized protein FIBRA_05025 [Fibroporia radiculosa]|uniref:tRNA dimethylallyltransferase n=1 Tax=Fibroporia radiculosa TaxID=599839 RepID=J4IAH3_9APHY|nr:uncharacterized protein FIBRA_05025 [Fibroporia radiculosa]CCM02911.1 predicted protein [Fibroporia radiculosa]
MNLSLDVLTATTPPPKNLLGNETSGCLFMALRPLITICGTTGVGKSKLAIELALALSQNLGHRDHGYQGARIINADAMQVYAGMDIITNKVPVAEQSGIEHLLMGFKQPGEQYIVTQWVQDAMQAIDDTHRRNQVPIVVGGTSYWIQHLVFPNRLVSMGENTANGKHTRGATVPCGKLTASLASLPRELADLFATLPEKAPSATMNPELALSLHSLLSALDPHIAERWHWKDTRKVLRNLIILKDTGRLPSEIFFDQSQLDVQPRYQTLCFWLYANPDILKPRLDARVDQMVQQGLLDEIRTLKDARPSTPDPLIGGQSDLVDSDLEDHADYTLGIYQSIGYKEFHQYLSHPGHSEEIFLDALQNMKAATRKYAKRQIMWIRNKLLPAIDSVKVSCKSNNTSPVAIAYLLDATEPSTWESSVRGPAQSITQNFLEGKELMNPIELSDTAREILGRVRQSKK